MISRTLVPRDVRPVNPDAVKKPPRRLETYMDERTVIPAGVSDAPPLDGKSSIPQHLPLGVLVERTLVPRGLPAKRFENFEPIDEIVPLAILDARVVVPAYVEPPEPGEIKEFVERPPDLTPELREVIEPDIFMTGDANLLIEPEVKKSATWDLITRSASVVVHMLLIVFLIAAPKIFPPHIPTRAETELASRQLGITYIAPDDLPKAPPGPPAPKVRVSPKVLNTVAPPRPESHAPVAPPAVPEKPPADLPSAPTPRVPLSPAPTQPTTSEPSRLLPAQPTPSGHLNLNIPNSTPGKTIEGQMQDAIRQGGSGTYRSGGGLAPSRGGGGGLGGRGGGGGAQVGNAATILTPTEGVDFNSYIQRLLATVKRNWITVMPESAMMGDKGMVFTTFQINSDGSVPNPDPLLERTSGKEPLDTAAMSAIRASNPFEPLPPAFHGPYIRIRLIFLYNLPIDYANSP